MVKLKSTTSNSVINALQLCFQGTAYHRHLSVTMAQSIPLNLYPVAFLHVTSTPYFPKSNGCAERAVQTMKSLLKHSDIFYLTILTYRTTRLPWCGLSPAELLMGLRANIPLVSEQH